jgi:type I restriction enzyme, S subunit
MITGWKKVKLHQIVDDLVMGQSPDSSTYNTEGIGLPFIQGNADMDDNHPKIRNFTSDPKKISLKDDILITVRAPVGDLYINNIERISIGRGIGAIRITEKNLASYVYQYFSWDKTQFIRLQQGTTFTEIGKREVRNLYLHLPESSNEQKAIVGILTKVDEAIETVQKSIEAVERLKKALMQNLLTGKIKPNGNWRSEEDFYFDEKIGKVPKEWVVSSVGLITDRKTISFNPQKSKSVKKYIALEHIEPGTFTRIGMGTSDETLSLKSEFSNGDVLLGKLRPYLNKVWIADIEGVCSTEFLVFPKNEFSVWLYLNFQSKRFLDYTTSMTAGTQHPRISWRDVKRYKVAYPANKEEREQIEEVTIAMEEERGKQLTKIRSLKNLKKSLMQNLLTGKVRLDLEKIIKLLEE